MSKLEIIKINGNKVEFKDKESNKIFSRKISKKGIVNFKKEKYFDAKEKLVKVPERFKHIDKIESYKELECYLKMIIDKFSKYNVPDESSNSISYSSTYSGSIQYFEKETAQHYYMQRYLVRGIKVGTAFWWHLDDDLKDELESEILYILYSASGRLYVNDSKVFVFESCGSNFSRYALPV